MSFEYHNESELCREVQNASLGMTREVGIASPIEMYEAVIIILVTGFFAVILAYLFSFIRKHVYRDEDNLDISFDAGGNVNAGLTATTVVSQWTWAATLLQSSTVAAKYGISGSIWYAAGASIQILLFSMLSIQLKTRAPGAKTFLQVIRARFGKRTHITFCCFALVTNVIVTAMLMLGGSAVITSLVKLISVEYATTLIAAILGGYTFIGGLGATFYVSYCNTAIIYIVMIILIFKVYEDGEGDDSNPLGSIESVFDLVSCSKGPVGNQDMSYLTIVSDEGLMFGLINIVGNFGTVFVDQSYWQSAVASKPKQGVLGLLLGGLAWFAIPFSFSTTMGLAYVALSAKQGEGLLTPDDVDAGLVPPVVAYHLLGKSGAILVMVMVLMAVTSTGSSEIMAVTSIIIYDIYALNLKPYRMTTDTNSCILCGKGRGRMANPRDKCTCISMTYCANCHQDTKNRAETRRAIKPEYKCPSHGQFREYNDYLAHLRNWSMVWTTIGIIPLTITLYMIQASLGWTYLFMGILVGSAVIPITLSMFWERLTGIAMIAGGLSGTGAALITWLAVASTYDGGLSDWYNNTGKEVSMLCGNLVSILGGGLVTVVVTFLTNRDFEPGQGAEIWEKTRDIDNPLSPWMEKYQKELNLSGAHQLDNRPSLQDVQNAFKRATTMAFSCSISTSLVLVVLWPACMVAVGVMDLSAFEGWVKLSEVWAFLAMILMIGLPLINEAWDIYTALMLRNKVGAGDDEELIRSMAAHGKQSIQSQPGKRNFSSASTAPPRGPKQKASFEEQNNTILPTITGNINEIEASEKVMTSSNGEQFPTNLKDATAKGLFQRPVEQNARPTSSMEGKVVGVQFNGALTGSGRFSPASATAQTQEDVPTVGFSTPKKSAAVEISKQSTESMNSGKYIRTKTGQSVEKIERAEFLDVSFSDVITPAVPANEQNDRVHKGIRSEREVSDLDEPLF